MPLLETDYCIEQISVPPRLPMILKQFCKSAIRTQPFDLLKWSSAYFHALANGEEPPTKLRLEYPPASSAHGLTIGFLKALLRQLGADYNKILPLECVLQRWDYLCLDRRDFELILEIGQFNKKCQIKNFLSIAIGLLTRSITETMIMVCELFTHEPDGGSAMIPIGLFMEIYSYLARLRCDGCEKGGTLEELCLCSSSTSEETSSDSRQKALEEIAQPPSVRSQDQDTEADLFSFALQSFGEETGDSFRHEGEASFRSTDHSESSIVKSFEKADGLKEPEPTLASDEAQDQMMQESDVTAAEPKKEIVKSESDQDQPCMKCPSEANYPDVAGIGRRLLPEEVATVAVWMTDCARRQGGMVGPRNIRHVNCPPLEGCACSQPPPSSDNESNYCDRFL